MVSRQTKTNPQETVVSEERSRRVAFALGLVLVVVTFIAYLPAIRGGFIWDDDSYVTNNQSLRSFQGLAGIWFDLKATPQYYPLVHTSYWVEYHLWGLDPIGYHLVNVLLHTASALLLWRLLAALRVPGAWVAAAVFALQPVHVESVAWITERKNVLSGMLYLASAIAYLQFAFEPGETVPRNTRIRCYTVALLLFLGALLSKTVTGSLPAAVLLVLWWKRGRIRLADVYPLIPFLVLALLLGSLTATMEKHHVGAAGGEWNFSPADRCLIAGRALWFYADKLVWPTPLIFIYPRWQINSHLWWQYLFPVAAIVVVVALWLARHRLGRGPLVAVLFFGGTLVPALGFFNVYPMRFSFVADHFQYLASIGPIMLAVGIGAKVAARIGPSGPRVASILVAAVLMLLGTLTYRQARVYTDLETLWRDTLGKNPSAWMAHNNLGLLLTGNGKPEEAMRHYNEALRLKIDYDEAYYNRGIIYDSQGAYDRAIRDYSKAIEIRPNFAKAYGNRGVIYHNMGAYDQAIRDYTKAIEIKPDSAETYTNRGITYHNKGAYDEAIRDFTTAIEIKPDSAKAYCSRGDAYDKKGDSDLAIRDYTKAIEIKPDFVEAHNNRGKTYGQMGYYDKAIVDFSRAIELNPGCTEAYQNRVMAYYLLKQYDQAWADVGKCQQLGGKVDTEFIKALTQASSRPE